MTKVTSHEFTIFMLIQFLAKVKVAILNEAWIVLSDLEKPSETICGSFEFV